MSTDYSACIYCGARIPAEYDTCAPCVSPAPAPRTYHSDALGTVTIPEDDQ